MRALTAEIDLDAVEYNVSLIKKKLSGAFLWAVLKANAYGHGIENVVPALSMADGLAFACVEEALAARRSGWSKEILLLEGFFDEGDLEVSSAEDLSLLIHCPEQIPQIKKIGISNLKCWIKLNTGMNRLGFAPEEYGWASQELEACGCMVRGAMTHFANAGAQDVPAGAPTPELQLEKAKASGCSRIVSANSAAVVLEGACCEARAGIIIYGVSPSADFSEKELGLKPALSLHTRIIAVRTIKAGECIGYGSLWRAQKESRIAVAACGYADGILRSSPLERFVFVDGMKLPVVGAVSMDMMMIDASQAPSIKVGSRVEIIGPNQTANEFAKSNGTIAAELLCALAPRVHRRVYRSSTYDSQTCTTAFREG